MAIKTSEQLYGRLSRFFDVGYEHGFVSQTLVKANLTYTTTYVHAEEENKPELLSQRIYGDARYWWFLLQFNGILDPNNLPRDTVINIPTLNGIF